MAMIFQYTKKDGSTAWMFKTYLGVDALTGKEIRTTKRGFSTKKEAKFELSKLLLDVKKNGFGQQKKTLYSDFYKLWFAQYKNTVRESTWVKTEELFRLHILPQFGGMYIDKINVLLCQKIINNWFKLTVARCPRLKSYSSNVFEYAMSLGIISSNPMASVKIPKKKGTIEKEEVPNFYEREELITFLNHVRDDQDTHIYVFFRLLAFSGFRKGEALALTWDDINFTDNTISITKTLTAGVNNRPFINSPKTKKSIRTISMDLQTMAILKKWRTSQKIVLLQFGHNTISKNQLVFSTHRYNSYYTPGTPRKWMLETVKEYNLKQITIHGFRHTHCSLLFEAGASIKEVQERLGHSDIKTTMNVYAHVSKKNKEETALKFAQFMNI